LEQHGRAVGSARSQHLPRLDGRRQPDGDAPLGLDGELEQAACLDVRRQRHHDRLPARQPHLELLARLRSRRHLHRHEVGRLGAAGATAWTACRRRIERAVRVGRGARPAEPPRKLLHCATRFGGAKGALPADAAQGLQRRPKNVAKVKLKKAAASSPARNSSLCCALLRALGGLEPWRRSWRRTGRKRPQPRQ